MLETFSNGKPFQGRAIWKMAVTVLASLKKALSLVPQLSPKIVNIDSTCRVVGYASGKNEQSFLQAIDKGMHEMDKRDRMGLSPDDDKRLGCLSGDEDEDADKVTCKAGGYRLPFFFRPLFAETSYVRFVPASDHLGIACLFHD